ncbi:MAG: SH3 domain-containing protein [Lachnospiraceae bacterium]|nr:SH3 domain-containing protein [Lachnospiraceae bacterium]
MNRFVKNHYHIISFFLLAIIFVAWVFLQNYLYSDTSVSSASDNSDVSTDLSSPDISGSDTSDNEPAGIDPKVGEGSSTSANNNDGPIDIEPVTSDETTVSIHETADNSMNAPDDISVNDTAPEGDKDLDEGMSADEQNPVEEIELETGSFGPGEGKMPFDLCLANVRESLNVRSGPGEDYDVIAKFLPVDYARVVERIDEWTMISSGEITGYCFNDYLIVGDKALNKLADKDKLTITVTHKLINIRADKNTEAEILRQAKEGESFKCIPSESDSNWFAIKYDDGNIAYVATTLAQVTAEMDNIDSITPVG